MIYDKIDDSGKRYRMVGKSREYEPTIFTSSGLEVPLSQARQTKEGSRERINKERDKLRSIPPAWICPFKLKTMKSFCDTGCALYIDNKCQLSLLGDPGKKIETDGKTCPLSGTNCRKECSLNQNGCILAKINIQGE